MTKVHYKGKTYDVHGKCPFCGTDKLTILWGYAVHVICTKCAMRGPKGLTPDEAVEKWNEVIE